MMKISIVTFFLLHVVHFVIKLRGEKYLMLKILIVTFLLHMVHFFHRSERGKNIVSQDQ